MPCFACPPQLAKGSVFITSQCRQCIIQYPWKLTVQLWMFYKIKCALFVGHFIQHSSLTTYCSKMTCKITLLLFLLAATSCVFALYRNRKLSKRRASFTILDGKIGDLNTKKLYNTATGTYVASYVCQCVLVECNVSFRWVCHHCCGLWWESGRAGSFTCFV